MPKQIGTYLEIEEITEKNAKTKKFIVKNKNHGDHLGIVKWNPAWRQYCFFTYQDVVFSAGCLEDIKKFVIDLNADHAQILKKRKIGEK